MAHPINLKLFRMGNRDIKMISGVASGLAYFCSLPVGLIRATFLFFTIFSPLLPIVSYIVLAIMLPRIKVDKQTFINKTSWFPKFHYSERSDDSEKSLNSLGNKYTPTLTSPGLHLPILTYKSVEQKTK